MSHHILALSARPILLIIIVLSLKPPGIILFRSLMLRFLTRTDNRAPIRFTLTNKPLSSNREYLFDLISIKIMNIFSNKTPMYSPMHLAARLSAEVMRGTVRVDESSVALVLLCQ
eukprot:201387_1